MYHPPPTSTTYHSLQTTYAAKLIRERQNQAATVDSSELSSFLSVSYQSMRADHLLCYRDHTYPYLQAHPFACHRLISKQWIVHPDESPFQQVIPSLSQQLLYPSLTALETSVNMAVSPPFLSLEES